MTMSILQDDPARPEPALPAATAGLRPVPRASKLLHWLTAMLVLAMFCSGVLMKQIGEGSLAELLEASHKSAGIGMLVLTAIRLGFRLFAQASGRWRKGAGSRPIHGVLYGALLLVPLLGWAGASAFGARDLLFGLRLPAIWPESAGHAELLFRSHAWLAFTMIGLVVVHIGIALGDYIQRGADAGAASPR